MTLEFSQNGCQSHNYKRQIWKADIFEHLEINHFLFNFCTYLKIMEFPLFFVSSNLTVLYSIWLPRASFWSSIPEPQIRRRKFTCSKKNGCQFTPNLTNEKSCQAKWPFLGRCLVGFLIFWAFPLIFGPIITHG